MIDRPWKVPGTYLINYLNEVRQLAYVDDDGIAKGRYVYLPENIWRWSLAPSYTRLVHPDSPDYGVCQAAWVCLELGLSDQAHEMLLPISRRRSYD